MIPRLAVPSPLRSLSLRHKITLCFSALLVLILALLWQLSSGELRQALRQQADDLGMALAEQTADGVRELVLANDLLGLNVVLNQLSQSDGIRRIRIYNVDGQPVAASRTPREDGPGAISYSAEITVQEAIAGTVEMELETAGLAAAQNRVFYYFLGVLAFGLLLIVAASYALASHIINPVLDMIQAIRSPLEPGLERDEQRGDEIAVLNNACASLLDDYRETNATLRPAAATMASLEDQAPAKLQASVLVVEVLNMDTAIEVLHPGTLAALLQEYSHYLRQTVRLYGGGVSRYSGAIAMAVFDVRGNIDHAFNAICSAQLFQRVMRTINDRHRRDNDQTLEFRLAIHSGEVFHTPSETSAAHDPGIYMGAAVGNARYLCRQSEPDTLMVSLRTCEEAGGRDFLNVSRSVEISFPADNMTTIACVVDIPIDDDLLDKQCRHLLQDQDNETG